MERDLPVCKGIRLKKYDYSQPGRYFITICTKARGENILCRIDASVGAAALGGPSPVNPGTLAGPPYIELTRSGEIVKGLIEKTDLIYPNVHVDAYVIMPDHIHMILELDGPPRAAAPTDAVHEHAQICGVPQVINALKGLSSKEIGERIWQRGYYDHIIRSNSDLQSIREYIQNNP